MPECQNCGSAVTARYVRVFAPPDEPTVRVCPNCDDIIRERGGIREARSTRGS